MQEVLFCLWSLALWHPAVVFGREGSIYDFLFELRKSSDGQVRALAESRMPYRAD
jgi:hypothetical protein